MKKNNLLATFLAAALLAGASVGANVAYAATPAYYVCFSTENYAVRNANKMTEQGGEYVLADVSLAGTTEFYVTDGAGVRYYSANDENLRTDESGAYAYDIKFSPTAVYSAAADGWAQTDCHITYRFHVPAAYAVTVGGEETPLTYNPYVTAYDEYYISSVRIGAGAAVAYGDETHTVNADGYYRILFTPGETRLGSGYLFDDKGVYGSGDAYKYHVYVEDAPRYFAAFGGGAAVETDLTINNEPAYLLTRDEKTTAARRYGSAAFFVPERDAKLKYRIYEETAGSYRLVDDDNDPDTAVSELSIADVGYYKLYFTDGGDTFLTATENDERDFGGWYALGRFNNYGYTADGGLDLGARYLFEKLADGDDDYDEDYVQYRLYLDVTAAELASDYELYISDGRTKYKNAGAYIRINAAGRYKFLFAEDHDYGRGRHYRYTLESGDADAGEVVIATVAEFNAFAAACNADAGYSVGKTVYLKNDLDFAGQSVVTVGTFGGTFAGGYHTLKNVTLSASDGDVGVFGLVTKNGRIERLGVENLKIDAGGADYVGFVCRNYGVIDGVTVRGSVAGGRYVGGVAAYNGRRTAADDDGVTDSAAATIEGKLVNCTNEAAVGGKVNVGGIAGFSGGVTDNCVNNGAVNARSFSSNDTVFNVGGVCGYSAGRLVSCANNAAVSRRGTGLYVGGLCGLSTGEIYFSENNGAVSGKQYVGGAAGYYGTISENEDDLSALGGIDYQAFIDRYFADESEDFEQQDGARHLVQYVLNTADVTAESAVGGIVGYSETDVRVRDCVSVADVYAFAGSRAGGIAGSAPSAALTGCVSGGRVRAEGLNGGAYVGGICGRGGNVRYSMSCAEIEGADYIGGICGGHTGALVGCYTNVSLVAGSGAAHVGAICGDTEAYDPAADSFADFASNYFVGTLGGIGGKTYGAHYDHAAERIAADRLASDGALSAYLDDGFSDEYWLGGDGAVSYPAVRYFETVDVAEEFGDDARFARLFDARAAGYTTVARDCARVSRTVTFKEWNKNKGELYDDGELQTDNFETVAVVRVFDGEAPEPPAFVYASYENGKWICAGNKAEYFVSYELPAAIDGNLVVYARYREIVTSLTCGKSFVEGRFAVGTTAELVRTGDYYGVRLTCDGLPLAAENITVKFYVGDDADKYIVKLIDGASSSAANVIVSGAYLAFDCASDALFLVEQASSIALPDWALGLICGVGGAAVAAAVIIVIAVIRKKRKNT